MAEHQQQQQQAGDAARSYTNFGGDTAGPLTPPTLPFAFGRDAFERPAFSPFFPFHSAPRLPAPASRNPARSRSPYSRPPRMEYVNPAPGPVRPIPSRGGGIFVPRGQPYSQFRSPFIQQQQRPPAMISSSTRPPRSRSPPLQQSPPPPMRSPPVSQKQQSLAFTSNKREFTRSPPSSAEEQQREDEARARRLERFKHSPAPEEPPEPKVELKIPKPLLTTSSMEVEDDWLSADPVLGTCSDMCPESERGERERKGDLDRYERVDGDRNQTSPSLAVKKYTRTPERDPALIRPLPVLRQTMDYLLGLLNISYGGEDLLSLYNFLWDRMRAVRMDLRMQHIFNKEAVVMHEQMIRLHVLVMHELCEFPKGEGFVEGFDSHLNIEQMNKAFSELFQMYVDHRRNGEPLSTEPEFRGYYTLLKLDVHLGFAVEPCDLSVQLASMNATMRSSEDVTFAREVARAYRLPNYIGFFRLAGKATYLQACLMHAQFPKIRIQALASLHSGLRTSQGIPLSQLTTWLGMEIGELEELLLYHGFSIKLFEEVYAVKDSELLNKEQSLPPSRSSLVESKRSLNIIDDILSPNTAAACITWAPDHTRSSRRDSLSILAPSLVRESPDEDMSDYDDAPKPKTIIPSPKKPEALQSFFSPGLMPSEPEAAGVEVEFPAIPVAAPEPPVVEEEVIVPERTKRPRPADSDEQELIEQHFPKRQETKNFGELATVEAMNAKKQEELARLREEQRKLEEVIAGRERLWFRRWKLRTDAKLETARVRRMEAQAALLAMNSGLPVYKSPVFAMESPELDLKQMKAQRLSVLEEMWVCLDVAAAVAPVLKRKNPEAGRVISWKLVFCAGERGAKPADAGQWLRSKLLGGQEDGACISVSSVEGINCYSITRVAPGSGDSLGNTLHGASALMFLVDDELQLARSRSRLHSLVDALPSGTRVPLLILAGLNNAEKPEEELARMLQLQRLDAKKISSWMISSLFFRGFYCSKTLGEGLEWLANSTQVLPELHDVDLRDLVSEKLENHLSCSELASAPDELVLAFNRALDDAGAELASSAASFPSQWPPPELELVLEREPELPFTGWNEEANLWLVLQALESCRLMPFRDICEAEHVSVAPGVSGEVLLRGVRAHYKSLRGGLEWYLSECLGYDPFESRREADMFLDRAASLKWSERGARVSVAWSRVFQGIFRSRLMILNSEPPPTVYITRKPNPRTVSSYEQRLQFGARVWSSGVGVRDDNGGNDGDDVPERIKDDIASFVSSYKRENEKEEAEPGEMREKMRRLREELKEVECAKRMKLPEFGDGVELPVTEAERELEMLVSRVNARLEKNGELIDDEKLGVDGSPSGVVSEWVDEVAPREPGCLEMSSGDGGDKLARLLERCHRAQLLVDEKLSLYFGVSI